jgi:hypothetical protein
MTMGIKKFHAKDNSTIQFYEAENCHMVAPFRYYVQKYSTVNFEINQLKFNREINEASFSRKLTLLNRLKIMAENEVKQKNQLSLENSLQPELISLLLERKKKQQQRLLKELKFTSETLYALPLYAWHKHNMPYSFFAVDHLPKELHRKVAPGYLYKNDDGNFEYAGYTDMTKREMEVAIKKRNKVISEFIGNEEVWFCFFRTMAGIQGTEHPHIGSPHIHFISSAWGISRDAIVEQLSSYRYSVNAETIAFIPREEIENYHD